VAESLIGASVRAKSGVGGIIRDSFGTRGVVSIEFTAPVKEDEAVDYDRFVEEEYSFGP
jgi:hypothetical protein